MNSQKTNLEIFRPIKQYLNILFVGDSKVCENFSNAECIELIEGFANEPSFINNLEKFAVELKKLDNPIGLKTKKNEFIQIFSNAKPSSDDVVGFVEKVSKQLGIDMNEKSDDKNSSSPTYKQSLEKIYNANKTKTGKEIFNLWENECWDSYVENKNAFAELKDKFTDNLDLIERKILQEFFEIKSGANTIDINTYIKDKNSHPNVRLNIKVDGNMAKIAGLFPKSVQKAFNDYLINKENTNPHFGLKGGDGESSDEYEPSTETLRRFSNWIRNIKRNLRETNFYSKEIKKDEYKSSENYVPDFKIENFQDEWKIDLDGNLYKKQGDKYVKYTETESDAKKFGKSDGDCKNLSYFSDSTKCGEFFEQMIKGNKIDKLNEIINDNDNFKNNLNNLKTNLNKVNPLFIIGTLKLFGFQKYTTINANGEKHIKVESFDNWWARQKQSGEPPSNMKEFFQLLIYFINNNEFVLNPTNKTLINKKQIPQKPAEKPLSYEDLEKLLKNKYRPTSIGISNSGSSLSPLLNLLIGMTHGGKFVFARNGNYYGGLVGGGDEKAPLECSTRVTKLYEKAMAKLGNKGPNDVFKNELQTKITALTALEHQVYDDLTILAKLSQFADVIGNNKMDKNEMEKEIEKQIKLAEEEYKKSSNRLDNRYNVLMSALYKTLYGKSIPTEFLSDF